MATVRMIKGDKYADIFDSPEMIKGAEADGYVLVTEEKTPGNVNTETDSGDKETQTARRGRTPRQ